jgi:hypothetical protein
MGGDGALADAFLAMLAGTIDHRDLYRMGVLR